MKNEYFLDGIKNIEHDDYIWWCLPWPKKEESDQCWYREPTVDNADQKRCRGCVGLLIPNPKLINFMEKNKDYVIFANMVKHTPYISTCFHNEKDKIIIACNHDVGIQKDEESGDYIVKNPEGSFQAHKPPVDFWKTIPSNIKRIYTKSVAVQEDIFRAVPNGLSIEFTNILVDHFNRLKNKTKENKNIVLLPDWADFTNSDRPYLKNKFKDINWVTFGTGWKTDCLDEIFCHRFCLSPIGNCENPYRLWECLYAGTIPIIKKSKALAHFDDLPILQVNSWDDISKEFLQEKYEEIHSKKYPMYKLKMSYWLDQMQTDIDEIRVNNSNNYVPDYDKVISKWSEHKYKPIFFEKRDLFSVMLPEVNEFDKGKYRKRQYVNDVLMRAFHTESMGDFFKEGMKILDYGCGYAGYANFMSVYLKDFLYYGIEPKTSSRAELILDRQNVDKRVKLGLIGSDIEKEAYKVCDVILLDSIFTHLVFEDFEEIMDKFKPVLDRDGIVVFSVWLKDKNYVEGISNDYEVEGCYKRSFYTLKSIDQYCENNNLELTNHGGIMDASQSSPPHVIFSARKKSE